MNVNKKETTLFTEHEMKDEKIEATLFTEYAGYGDLVYHTPMLRYLANLNIEVHFNCLNAEPFLNLSYIKTLKEFKTKEEAINACPHHKSWTYIPLNTNAHNCIHTVDYVSLKTMNIILRDQDKTLDAAWTEDDLDRVKRLLKERNINKRKFVVLSPSITWKSRTLPLSYAQEIIANVQKRGFDVVLVGKEIPSSYYAHADFTKTLYDASLFPNTCCLYNQLTFAELCALYSITPIAINIENGNHPISCTNDYCWDLYIPSLTPPEFRLPFRHGTQKYRTAVAANEDNFYPTYRFWGRIDGPNVAVRLPKIQRVLALFDQIVTKIEEGKNQLD